MGEWIALHPALRHSLIAALGALLAAALHEAWSFETRWLVVAVAMAMGLAAAMIFLRRLFDFLLWLTLMTLPLAGFIKFAPISGFSDNEVGGITYGGRAGIGLIDFLLLGMILTWLCRQAPASREPRQGWGRIDIAVLLFLAASAGSIVGAPDQELAWSALAYLLRYIGLYFVVSRNLQPRHATWVIGAMLFTLAIEAVMGMVQGTTGHLLGLGRDKGAGGPELETQYEVPGIEQVGRATGTTYDSHAYALVLAMLLPYPALLVVRRGTTGKLRLPAIGLLVLGMAALVFSYSRSGYITLALSLLVPVAIMTWRGDLRGLGGLFAAMLILAPLSPWAVSHIVERFASAPVELVEARFEQYGIALSIWRDHFAFGFGIGNYMVALRSYSVTGALELAVHNAFLWLAAETGILGAVGFFVIVLFVALDFARALRRRDLGGLIAMAGLTATVAYVLDSLTDAAFREPNVFTIFWLNTGIAAALMRQAWGYSHRRDEGMALARATA